MLLTGLFILMVIAEPESEESEDSDDEEEAEDESDIEDEDDEEDVPADEFNDDNQQWLKPKGTMPILQGKYRRLGYWRSVTRIVLLC